MKDILLKDATLSEIEERLEKLGEQVISTANGYDIIEHFNFFNLDEDEKINLIFKILNPFESNLTFLDEEKIKKQFNLK